MPDSFRFVWEPGWQEKAWHFRSSLNPLGNAVRAATDQIGYRVRAQAEAEASRATVAWRSAQGSLRGNFRQNKLRFFHARALSHSLRAYARSIRFIMVHGAAENYGAVVTYHKAGDRIEFGGNDPKYKLGDTGATLNYPAYGFLRRGLTGG